MIAWKNSLVTRNRAATTPTLLFVRTPRTGERLAPNRNLKIKDGSTSPLPSYRFFASLIYSKLASINSKLSQLIVQLVLS